MAKTIQAKGLNLETYNFVDADQNHLFSVKFNPADLNIARRYDEVVEWLNNITISEESGSDSLFELSDELREKIDYLFGIKDGSDILECNPFSPTEDGRLFIEVAIENIGDLIESEMNVRTKKVKGRMDKYTAKYSK